MQSNSLTLAARYVFPVEGPPIEEGGVTILDGRIAWIGPLGARRPDYDLGNVAIVPGFVNAHTHLELSALKPRRAASAGPENEVEWLRRVVEQRRTGTERAARGAVTRNLTASVAAGTTALADITTAGLSWRQVAQAPVRGIVFAELIGLHRARGLQTTHEAWTWLARINPQAETGKVRAGLSPHAPYSTAGWLYHKAVSGRLPLSTHLAEMPEELELLERREGPLRGFLEELGAWDEEWEPIGASPADYVRKGELRQADWLIAHGTYFDPSEFWQFRPEAAPSGQRVAIAFCPRTHARFGHAPHPYRALLERGVIVCLGTDSLASSPTLSVLDEARFLYRHDPSLGGALLLTMATLFGAWALRIEATAGSLRVGKAADLAVVALPDRDEPDPHVLLFASDRPVVATVFQGELVSGSWKTATGA
ncbi:MAG: amidohydrolase family protein [Isosphaeraceae bacterium]|nr:amidohydrolase family protein [Isosphaeraceae bacterium]